MKKNNVKDPDTDFDRHEQALDILENAYYAEDEKTAAKFAKEALKLDPDLTDAKRILIDTYPLEKQKKEYEKLIKQEEARLGKMGVSDDDVGAYYGLIETGPYMRIRYAYMELLENMNKLRMAIAEGEDIIRLNEGDNMGVRYKLIKLYAMLEDGEKLERLVAEYNEESVHFLLPQAVYYYKTDELTKARGILKRMYKENAYIKALFDGKLERYEDEIDEELSFGGYRVGGPSEVVDMAVENAALIESSFAFAQWAEKEFAKIAKQKA